MLQHRLVVALCLVWAHVFATGPLAAQTSGDRAMAESLFQQGRELMTAGDTESACAKFAESQSIEAAVGTSLNLATCYEALGKTASAWAEFARALALAEREGDRERAALAETRITALSALLSRIILHPPPSSEPLSLTIDGRELSEGAWNSPLPLDPGPHELRVTAAGHLPWTTRLELPEGPGDVVVEVPPLQREEAPRSEVNVPAADSVKLAEPPAPARNEKSPQGVPVELWISVGVTAAAVVVGTVATVDFHDQKSIIEAHCDGRYCDDVGLTADDQARSSARIADISFGTAAVAGIFAGYLWYTLPDSEGASFGLTSLDIFGAYALGVGGRY